jgi:hypothetical protein
MQNRTTKQAVGKTYIPNRIIFAKNKTLAPCGISQTQESLSVVSGIHSAVYTYVSYNAWPFSGMELTDGLQRLDCNACGLYVTEDETSSDGTTESTSGATVLRRAFSESSRRCRDRDAVTNSGEVERNLAPVSLETRPISIALATLLEIVAVPQIRDRTI